MAIVQRRLTLEEFLEWPEAKPAFEYVDGTVTQKVSPQGQHSALQFGTAELFNRAGMPGKLWRAFPELRATFDGASPVPDVSVYRWERIPVTEQGRVANLFRIAPDVAIEIRSPGQSLKSQIERCQWYVDHGVPVSLLVDPGRDTIRAFRAGQIASVLRGGERVDLSDVLPGFSFSVSELFGSLSMQ